MVWKAEAEAIGLWQHLLLLLLFLVFLSLLLLEDAPCWLRLLCLPILWKGKEVRQREEENNAIKL